MEQWKVFITDHEYPDVNREQAVLAEVNAAVVELQCKDETSLTDRLADADGIITQYAPLTKKVINSLRKCKIIARYGIGVDNVDVAAATSKGIYVTNVPDYCLDEVATHAVALILALSRNILVLDREVRCGIWKSDRRRSLARPSTQTVGLLGFGKIGRMVAHKARALGFQISVYDPYLTTPEEVRQSGVACLDMKSLLRTSDYISIHLPLSRQTFHLIGEKELGLMKPTGYLINTARGAIVDQQALVKFLKSKRIAGAGLDVFENEPLKEGDPLLKLENVILSPHLAWYSADAQRELQGKVAQEVVRVLRGERPKFPVNVEAENRKSKI